MELSTANNLVLKLRTAIADGMLVNAIMVWTSKQMPGRSNPSERDRVSFSREARATALLQHCPMKLVPIVKIVEVHRIFECRSVVRDAACAQNPLARFVVVIVAAHRRIVLLDGFPI